MLKMRKIYVSALMNLAVCFVIGLSATDSFAQKGGKGRYRKVSLRKNAKKNGYTTTTLNRVTYFEANGVEDPITKKLIEALKDVEFRCKQTEPLIRLSLTFSNGNSQRVAVSCPILIEPTILIGNNVD